MKNSATTTAYTTPEVFEVGDSFVTLNQDGSVARSYVARNFFEDAYGDLMVVVRDGCWVMFEDVRVAA
jgi:hypothetical protein